MKRNRLYLAAACLPPLAYLIISIAATTQAGQGYRQASSLDDAYIYFQYARQAAEGNFFSYFAGDPASSGVTGILYLFLLAGLSKLGIEGPAAAWAVGSAAWFISLFFLLKIRERSFPGLKPWGLLALLLSLGPYCGAFFNGLETGLFFALLFAALEAAATLAPPRRLWLLLALLAWSRPEGQLAAFCIGAWSFWMAPAAEKPWKLSLASLALALGPSLLLLSLTGSMVPDSVRAKSVSALTTPYMQRLSESADFLMAAIKGLGMGFYGNSENLGFVGDGPSGNPLTPHYPPLMLLVALYGAAVSAHRGQKNMRGPWMALIAWAVLGLALQAWNLPVGWHQHRYLTLYAPALLIGCCLAFDALSDPALRRALLLLYFGFGLASAPWALAKNFENTLNYRLFHGQAAAWLRENLSPGTPVAAVDAGILAWESGMRIVDLPGITDHRLSLAAARARSEGSAAIFRELASRPEAQRPRYAVMHERRLDFKPQDWVRAGILSEIARIQHGSEAMVIYRWNWPKAQRPLK